MQSGNTCSRKPPRRARASVEDGAVAGAADVSSRFDALPVELLLHVFSFLDTKTLMVAVPAVCRRWREVCGHTPRVRADLSFVQQSLRRAPLPARLLRSSLPLHGLASALQRFKHIESVLIPSGSDAVACAAAVSCPRLSVVDFTCRLDATALSLNLTDIGLIAIAELCPLLKSIDVRQGCFTDAALAALTENCPKLTSLIVGGFGGGISNAGVRTIVQQYGSQLTSIHFENCTNLGDDAIIAIPKHCPRLIAVGFPDSAMTGAGMVALAQHYPRLTSVDFHGCYELTDADMVTFVQHCPLLTRVDISDCAQLTDRAVVTLAEKCKQLALVNAIGCTWLADNTLIALGKHCPLLTTVDFTECSLVTDSGVIALAEGCTLLTSVGVSDCRSLTDVGVIELAKHCAQLKVMTLRGCDHLTDASVVALGEHCIHLEIVDLRMCTQVALDPWPLRFDRLSYAQQAAWGYYLFK